ncbi:NUDIX hydrolase [Streptacidiphilus anmyonensis]|uniref:NUDIX hydrolase n=1 Tax=Streptacidiphilus anmyonensis TaxID=405782 RepID=UPI000ADE971F|nr:CoA pyrophosphatase [Streptacidiphilus anmyonensis]
MSPDATTPPLPPQPGVDHDTIRRNLAAFPRRSAVTAGGRAAAVAVCVLPSPTGPQLLMIKRAAKGRNAGQWALPGGRVEPGEGSAETALRELAEETGVEAPASAVAGLLDDYVAGTGFVITPVVVLLDAPPARLRRCPREVHSLHRVPLARLCDPDVPRWRETPDGGRLLQMPLRRTMVVHAPTGALLWQFREVALLGRPTRVSGLDEPDFARS